MPKGAINFVQSENEAGDRNGASNFIKVELFNLVSDRVGPSRVVPLPGMLNSSSLAWITAVVFRQPTVFTWHGIQVGY
jgi:hypothetical protein